MNYLTVAKDYLSAAVKWVTENPKTVAVIAVIIAIWALL